jgi:DHA2 family methylenomycin A resistance protein-like MFS transporter
LYLQRVHGYDPLRSDLAYLPLTATFFAVNVFSGWLVGPVGFRLPMLLGALLDAVGFALLANLDAHSSYWRMLPAFTLIPLGMGLGVPAMTTAVLSSVDNERAGLAGAVLNAARQAAGAIGVAVFGALAGDEPGRIVHGLSIGALISVAALLAAALLAALAMRARS